MQIIHSCGDNWIVAATVGDTNKKTVKVYDSLYNNIDDGTCKIISNAFGPLAAPCNVNTQKQSGIDDC